MMRIEPTCFEYSGVNCTIYRLGRGGYADVSSFQVLSGVLVRSTAVKFIHICLKLSALFYSY